MPQQLFTHITDEMANDMIDQATETEETGSPFIEKTSGPLSFQELS